MNGFLRRGAMLRQSCVVNIGMRSVLLQILRGTIHNWHYIYSGQILPGKSEKGRNMYEYQLPIRLSGKGLHLTPKSGRDRPADFQLLTVRRTANGRLNGP